MIDEKKIKKAAIECADEYYSLDYGKDREETNREIFTKGVQWALQESKKSLWHDASEEPEDCAYCLICTPTVHLCYWNSYDKCWDEEETDDYFCEMSLVERWCYIKDLLPTKGGEL